MSYNPENRTSLQKHKFARSAYSEKLEVSITFEENSPFTRQEFREECDINTIMAQYMTQGELIHLNEAAPQYLDVTGQDFREHMIFIAGANSMFNDLPSSIRSQFDNDPAEFLDFCSQEKNRPELAQMGLLSPEATQAVLHPSPAPSAAPTAPAAPSSTAPEPPAPAA